MLTPVQLSIICKYVSLFVELLWVAPEHLRTEEERGILEASRPGDIYSLAILCAEIITRQHVFFTNDDKSEEGSPSITLD